MRGPSSSDYESGEYDPRAPWQRTLDDVARWLFYISLGAAFGALAYLVWAIVNFAGVPGDFRPEDAARLKNGIALVGQVYLLATIILVLSVSWLFHEKDFVGYIFLGAGCVVYWGLPFVLQALLQKPIGVHAKPLSGAAFEQIQLALWVYLVPAIFLIIADLVKRIALGPSRGMRDLTYGAGLLREEDIKQRFLGKCWQLPFCTKNMRMRCPIYHARRHCWREKVGCLCEPNSIREAMKNVTVFTRDRETNAHFIPYNRILGGPAKRERCRNCAIYESHQLQKYQVLSPIAIFAVIALAYLKHSFLLTVMVGWLGKIDQLMRHLSIFPSQQNTKGAETMADMMQNASWAAELMYLCLVLLAVSYSIKGLEWLMFKVQI
ncbi:MAG: hypothetical protein WCO51_01535 [bacterium]|jgi:hypothetical protein